MQNDVSLKTASFPPGLKAGVSRMHSDELCVIR
jgi:hypothetical protein